MGLLSTFDNKKPNISYISPPKKVSNISPSRLSSTNSPSFNPPPRDGLPIYMDYQSTTPLDPRVLDSMLPYFTTHYGNPSSRTHSFGWTAEQAIQASRSQISTLLNCTPSEIIFTSGATESNNLAIKGLAQFYLSQNIKPHFITLLTEHKCVLQSFLEVQNLGCEVTFLPVNKSGLLDLDTLRNAIKPNTKLVSVMAVNNEIGTVQDLAGIGSICRESGIAFHTDAAQAVGKLDIDLKKCNISLLSGSGHKIYGPKGIGFLFVNKRNKNAVRPRIVSILKGGDQEYGLRAGTIPTPLVVGLGKACEIAKKEMARDYQMVKRLSDRLVSHLKRNLKDIQHNGAYLESENGSEINREGQHESNREEQGELSREGQHESNREDQRESNREGQGELSREDQRESSREEQDESVRENQCESVRKGQGELSKKGEQDESVRENQCESVREGQGELSKKGEQDESNKEGQHKSGSLHNDQGKGNRYLKSNAETTGNEDLRAVPDLRRNTSSFTYPGCANISFSYVEGEGLLMKLKNIALSTGSACTSSSLEPSYVLRALKVDDDLAHSSIRFGISKFTTKKDIDRVKKLVVEKVKELRDMSPLFEMVNEGIDLKSIQWTQAEE